MSAPASCPAAGEVCVWHVHAAAAFSAPEARDRALAWLTPRERDRHDRYRHAHDRDMFLLGRAVARVVVGDALGVAPTAWPWREGPRGRPEVDEPACDVSFNLAHSGGLVVCAVAREAHVGVDVEDRRRAALDRNLVARYCSPAERVDIDARGEIGWQDRFLQYWTLKEAYLKARGLGIAVSLADLSFVIKNGNATIAFERTLKGSDTHWAFNMVHIDDRHYVAVAVTTETHPAPTFALRAVHASFLLTS